MLVTPTGAEMLVSFFQLRKTLLLWVDLTMSEEIATSSLPLEDYV